MAFLADTVSLRKKSHMSLRTAMLKMVAALSRSSALSLLRRHSPEYTKSSTSDNTDLASGKVNHRERLYRAV